jgi:hypothetical protein
MKFSDMLSEKLAEFELKAAREMDDGGWLAGGVKV